MTIARDPLTFDAAVTIITDLIGCDGAARAVGKSVSLIEKWSRPGTDRSPNVAQALALDVAYIMAGGTGAPMHEMHEALLTREVGDTIACRRALGEALAEASTEMGEAFAAAMPLFQPGASPQQRSRALRETEQAYGAVGRMLRRVKSFLPTAARGCTSTIGQGPGGAQ